MGLPSIAISSGTVRLGHYEPAMRRAVIALSAGEATERREFQDWQIGRNGPLIRDVTMNALIRRGILDITGKRHIGIETRIARLNAKGRATYDAITAAEEAA